MSLAGKNYNPYTIHYLSISLQYAKLINIIILWKFTGRFRYFLWFVQGLWLHCPWNNDIEITLLWFKNVPQVITSYFRKSTIFEYWSIKSDSLTLWSKRRFSRFQGSILAPMVLQCHLRFQLEMISYSTSFYIYFAFYLKIH